MALDTRAIVRIVGAVLGGAATAAVAIKKMPTPHVGQKVLAGMATIGGATVGYYVAGWIANRVIRDDVEKLPADQVTALPGGSKPVETPSASSAMGAVAEREAAVSSHVSREEVSKGPVVDIKSEVSNVVPFKAASMDVTAFGSDPR